MRQAATKKGTSTNRAAARAALAKAAASLRKVRTLTLRDDVATIRKAVKGSAMPPAIQGPLLTALAKLERALR